jgi:hypothetical protein
MARQAYKSVWEIYSRPLHGLHTDILRHLFFFFKRFSLYGEVSYKLK